MKIIEMLLAFILKMAELLTRMSFQLMGAVFTALFRLLSAGIAHLWNERQRKRQEARTPIHANNRRRRPRRRRREWQRTLH